MSSTTIRETCGICGGTLSVTSQYTSSAELIARRWLTNHLCIDAYRRICSTSGCKRAEGHSQKHTTASPQQAAGATEGELHPCDPRPNSVPAAGLTGATP